MGNYSTRAKWSRLIGFDLNETEYKSLMMSYVPLTTRLVQGVSFRAAAASLET